MSTSYEHYIASLLEPSWNRQYRGKRESVQLHNQDGSIRPAPLYPTKQAAWDDYEAQVRAAGKTMAQQEAEFETTRKGHEHE